ncbi:hypothetical protein KIF53_15605 [Chromobacterium subtsugae]|uniref:Uncharacterized protein n=1 Tax=Chromobacterium subtsugae TaxID=251747 RepID=A0ABS7FIE4_9NEIS|nr:MULTISPECIES: hypothetical protein [Chromobacterium]KUM02734.1 hypothetical protein Cv017_01395 [Chromobacterium subtsugae]MBW7567832.1 hypothetical protein [Chromobacterium subtsugae]MBW8289059.1 hypothetical protein [Chromobacterium subtsugae]WSE93796.1 hypothetical protein U6115_11290 [Chromobacterium subtsugae]WVH62173.1 hypothetical protein U6151_11310 [Chromobacterium subtsugae]
MGIAVFRDKNGKEVMVNPSAVSYARESDQQFECVVIHFVDDQSSIIVRDTFSAVLQALRNNY